MAIGPSALADVLLGIARLRERGFSIRAIGRESGIAEGTLRRTFINLERVPRASTIARVHRAIVEFGDPIRGPRTIRRHALAPSRAELRRTQHPDDALAVRGVIATGDPEYDYMSLMPVGTADLTLEEYADRLGIDPRDLVTGVWYVEPE